MSQVQTIQADSVTLNADGSFTFTGNVTVQFAPSIAPEQSILDWVGSFPDSDLLGLDLPQDLPTSNEFGLELPQELHNSVETQIFDSDGEYSDGEYSDGEYSDGSEDEYSEGEEILYTPQGEEILYTPQEILYTPQEILYGFSGFEVPSNEFFAEQLASCGDYLHPSPVSPMNFDFTDSPRM